jgi:hypothetical protein
MELQLSPDQTLLVLGILFAVAVGFLIPRKPAEDFIEWALKIWSVTLTVTDIGHSSA